MSMVKLGEAGLQAWVDRLIEDQSVVGVKARGDRFVFGPLSSGTELRLDYDVTVLPPKKFLLPPKETLLRFSMREGYEAAVEAEPLIIIGVHPYDVVAIAQMDAVFSKDNVDTNYMARREQTVIIACDVRNSSPNVFASCMGTATVQEGFDILLSKVGDVYLADARSPKGEEILAAADGEEPDAASLARREQLWEDNERLLRNHQLKTTPDQLPEILEGAYDHPIWEQRAAQCHSCGSCNLVCPTCYCFDVQDEMDWSLESGKRTRKWDGCMLSEFALVAGGHNFRGDRAARYRHRYYRKGKYLWDRMGQIACVGCGRCVTACTTRIANPVEIYNALQEDR